jgi:RNA recognition motif-containing protein
MEILKENLVKVKETLISTEIKGKEDKKLEDSKKEPLHVPSLYVGDLSPQITENDLEKIFSTIGTVKLVKICKDIGTGSSLGYGFVNFENLEDAEKAMIKLNHFIPPGPGSKPLRIMWDYKDKKIHRTGDGNIFLKDLPFDINSKTLEKIYSKFGKILSCKVCTDEGGFSLGYGFINFENEKDSKEAILKTNGKMYGGKKIFVGPFLSKKKRKVGKKKNFYTNIFIKNISADDCNEKFINDLFGIFGKITSIYIHKNNETSGAVAFVNFEDPRSAEDAIFRMNNKKIKNLTLYVGKGKNKFHRQRSLKKKFLIKKIGQIEKPIDSILIGYRIPPEIRDEQIISAVVSKEVIKNCKIFGNAKEEKKKFCFVWFSCKKILETKFGKNKSLLIKIEKRENFLIKNCLSFKKIYNLDNMSEEITNKKRTPNNLDKENRGILENNGEQVDISNKILRLLHEAKEKGKELHKLAEEEKEREKLEYEALKIENEQ